MSEAVSLDELETKESLCDPVRYHLSKVFAERAIGSVLLIFAAPVIFVIVCVVRLSSSGKGIYKQVRVGKDGREFSIYKIRSMYQDAEACGTPRWSTRGDSRITPVGRVLRFLHLDELPQLINVARGEMSLVGPRPERPEFVKQLAITVPNYLDRLQVLPGVTGLAQINLPADESLESVRKKVILDCEYIRTASLNLDLRIFFCTFFRMTGLRHGVAPRLFGIERDPDKLASSFSARTGNIEFTSSLDDSQISIPSMLAAVSVNEDGESPAAQEQPQAAYATHSSPTSSLPDVDTPTEDISRRNPR